MSRQPVPLSHPHPRQSVSSLNGSFMSASSGWSGGNTSSAGQHRAGVWPYNNSSGTRTARTPSPGRMAVSPVAVPNRPKSARSESGERMSQDSNSTPQRHQESRWQELGPGYTRPFPQSSQSIRHSVHGSQPTSSNERPSPDQLYPGPKNRTVVTGTSIPKHASYVPEYLDDSPSMSTHSVSQPGNVTITTNSPWNGHPNGHVTRQPSMRHSIASLHPTGSALNAPAQGNTNNMYNHPIPAPNRPLSYFRQPSMSPTPPTSAIPISPSSGGSNHQLQGYPIQHSHHLQLLHQPQQPHQPHPAVLGKPPGPYQQGSYLQRQDSSTSSYMSTTSAMESTFVGSSNASISSGGHGYYEGNTTVIPPSDNQSFASAGSGGYQYHNAVAQQQGNILPAPPQNHPKVQMPKPTIHIEPTRNPHRESAPIPRIKFPSPKIPPVGSFGEQPPPVPREANQNGGMRQAEQGGNTNGSGGMYYVSAPSRCISPESPPPFTRQPAPSSAGMTSPSLLSPPTSTARPTLASPTTSPTPLTPLSPNLASQVQQASSFDQGLFEGFDATFRPTMDRDLFDVERHSMTTIGARTSLSREGYHQSKPNSSESDVNGEENDGMSQSSGGETLFSRDDGVFGNGREHETAMQEESTILPGSFMNTSGATSSTITPPHRQPGLAAVVQEPIGGSRTPSPGISRPLPQVPQEQAAMQFQDDDGRDEDAEVRAVVAKTASSQVSQPPISPLQNRPSAPQPVSQPHPQPTHSSTPPVQPMYPAASRVPMHPVPGRVPRKSSLSGTSRPVSTAATTQAAITHSNSTRTQASINVLNRASMLTDSGSVYHDDRGSEYVDANENSSLYESLRETATPPPLYTATPPTMSPTLQNGLSSDGAIKSSTTLATSPGGTSQSDVDVEEVDLSNLSMSQPSRVRKPTRGFSAHFERAKERLRKGGSVSYALSPAASASDVRQGLASASDCEGGKKEGREGRSKFLRRGRKGTHDDLGQPISPPSGGSDVESPQSYRHSRLLHLGRKGALDESIPNGSQSEGEGAKKPGKSKFLRRKGPEELTGKASSPQLRDGEKGMSGSPSQRKSAKLIKKKRSMSQIAAATPPPAPVPHQTPVQASPQQPKSLGTSPLPWPGGQFQNGSNPSSPYTAQVGTSTLVASSNIHQQAQPVHAPGSTGLTPNSYHSHMLPVSPMPDGVSMGSAGSSPATPYSVYTPRGYFGQPMAMAGVHPSAMQPNKVLLPTSQGVPSASVTPSSAAVPIGMPRRPSDVSLKENCYPYNEPDSAAGTPQSQARSLAGNRRPSQVSLASIPAFPVAHEDQPLPKPPQRQNGFDLTGLGINSSVYYDATQTGTDETVSMKSGRAASVQVDNASVDTFVVHPSPMLGQLYGGVNVSAPSTQSQTPSSSSLTPTSQSTIVASKQGPSTPQPTSHAQLSAMSPTPHPFSAPSSVQASPNGQVAAFPPSADTSHASLMPGGFNHTANGVPHIKVSTNLPNISVNPPTATSNKSPLPEVAAQYHQGGSGLPLPSFRRNLTLGRKLTVNRRKTLPRVTLPRQRKKTTSELWDILRRYVLRRKHFTLMNVLFVLQNRDLSSRYMGKYLEIPDPDATVRQMQEATLAGADARHHILMQLSKEMTDFFCDALGLDWRETYNLTVQSCFLPVDTKVETEVVTPAPSPMARTALPDFQAGQSPGLSERSVKGDNEHVLAAKLTNSFLKALAATVTTRMKTIQKMKDTLPKDHFLFMCLHSFHQRILSDPPAHLLQRTVRELIEIFKRTASVQLPKDEGRKARSAHEYVYNTFEEIVNAIARKELDIPSPAPSPVPFAASPSMSSLNSLASSPLPGGSRAGRRDTQPIMPTPDRLLDHVQSLFGIPLQQHQAYLREVTSTIVENTRMDFETYRSTLEDTKDMRLQYRFESVDLWKDWRNLELQRVTRTLQVLNKSGTLWRYVVNRKITDNTSPGEMKQPSAPLARLIVAGARDLTTKNGSGLPDSYCSVRLTGNPAGIPNPDPVTSTIVQKNSNPVWENVRIELPLDSFGDIVEISVWHWANPTAPKGSVLSRIWRDNGDGLMGKVKLRLPVLLNQVANSRWTDVSDEYYSLRGKSRRSYGSGQVRVIFELLNQTNSERGSTSSASSSDNTGAPNVSSLHGNDTEMVFFSAKIACHYKNLFRMCLEQDHKERTRFDSLSTMSVALLTSFARRWALSDGYTYVVQLNHLISRLEERTSSYAELDVVMRTLVPLIHSKRVILTKADHDSVSRIADMLARLASEMIEKYRDYFPFNTPDGELEAVLRLYAVLHDSGLLAYVDHHSKAVESIKEMVNKGNAQFWSILSSRAEPIVDDKVIRLIRLTKYILDYLEDDTKYFATTFSPYFDVVKCTLETWRKFYVLEIESLLTSTEDASFEVNTDVFGLMNEVRKLITIGHKHGHQLDIMIDIDRLFSPYVLRVIKQVGDQAGDMVRRALQSDPLKPASDRVLHSISIADISKILHHLLNFIRELKFPSQTVHLKFLKQFADVVYTFMSIYCDMLWKGLFASQSVKSRRPSNLANSLPPALAARLGLIQDTASEVGADTSSIAGSQQVGDNASSQLSDEEALKFRKTAMRLNNVQAANVLFIPQLFSEMELSHFRAKFDGDGSVGYRQSWYKNRGRAKRGSPLRDKRRSRPPVSDASRTKAAITTADPHSHLVITLRVIKAENIMAQDWNGSSDPYVIIRFDGKEVGRTRVISSSLFPRFDEQFDIRANAGKVLDSNSSVYLDMVVMDEDIGLRDDEVGLTRFWMQPKYLDGSTHDLVLPLHPQGTLSVRLTVHAETGPSPPDLVQEIDKCSQRIEQRLAGFLRDASAKWVDELTPLIIKSLEDVIAFYTPPSTALDKAFGMLGKERQSVSQELPTHEDIEIRLDAMLQYLDDRLSKINEYLDQNLGKDVIRRFWNQIVIAIEALLVPNLGHQSRSRPPVLDPRQLEALMIAMEVLKAFFYADGEGISWRRLESSRYNRVKLIAELYFMESTALMEIYNATHATLQASETSFTPEIHPLKVLEDEPSPENGSEYRSNSTSSDISYLGDLPDLGELANSGMADSPGLDKVRLVNLLKVKGDHTVTLNILKARGENAFVDDKLKDLLGRIFTPPWMF